MSDINEIKKDNEQLDQALSYVRSQRPHDQANQKEYIDMEKRYKIELDPLQKEFTEKLKEYMELSTQYYGEYVPISVAHNKERQASWDKQMGDYESYNQSSDIERRQKVEREQAAWNAEKDTLDDDYQSALDQYNEDKEKWENTKNERARVLDEARSGILAAKSKRDQWNDDHDPDYLKNAANEYARRFNALMISPNSNRNTRTLDIQYLRNRNIQVVKRVAIVDSVTNDRNIKNLYGIVGADNAKRETFDNSMKPVLIHVGMFRFGKSTAHHKINSSTVRVTIPYSDAEVDYAKNDGTSSSKEVRGMSKHGTRSGHGKWDRYSAKILTHDKNKNPSRLYLEVSRTDKTGDGWGQDLYLWVKVPSDVTSLDGPRGRITPQTIWGSGMKSSAGPARQIVFSSNYSTIPGFNNIDTVPRWINYPMGPWDSDEPLHNQEDFGTESQEMERVYYTLINVDYEDIAEYNSKGEDAVLYAVGAVDNKAYVLLNSLDLNGFLMQGGYGGRPNSYKIHGKLHPGPNMIFIIHENGGGPAGVCMAFFIGDKRGLDSKKMVASTGPNWLAFKTPMNISTNTNHKIGRGLHNGYFSNFSDFRAYSFTADQCNGGSSCLSFNPYELKNALEGQNLIQPIKGSYGVQVHNYDPPTAKVQTIRIKLANLPPKRKIILKQFQIFSTDRYDENAARAGSVALSSSRLDNASLPITTLVNGDTKPNNQNKYFETSESVSWRDQYVEFKLNNPITVFKVVIYGDVGTGPYLSQQMVEMRDREGKIIFSGAPLGSDTAVKHELYFNSPVVPEGSPTPPDKPTKKSITRDYPVYTPGQIPPYPIMPAYITPNEELLTRLIMLSDDLITLNLRIQEVYKKYTMDNHIDNYQFSVLNRRRDLLTEVKSLIAHRKKLDKRIGDYTATRKNQIDQERRASSSQIHFWIWGCVTILVFAVGVLYLLYPSKMYYTPQLIAWGIIILVTTLTTMFIGGSITYMLWLFIVLNIFFYSYKKRYG
jgi:hypothetical protein